MIGKSSSFLINSIYTVQGFQQYSRTMNKANQQTKLVEKSTQKLNGRMIQYTRTTTKAGTSVTAINKSMANGAGASNDFVNAMKRAIVVAPIWLALRQVMVSVIGTIKDGAKQIEDFNKQLRLTKPVITSFTLTNAQAFEELEATVRELSKSTGIAVEDITKAFFRFGTLGISFEESIAGANEALKLSILLGGDLDKTASTLAVAYKLLGDTLDKSLTPTEQFADVGAKIFKVYKTNAFLIDEFSGSLDNFIATANVSNISLNDTIALLTALSTAGIRGARGGRLLRTSIFKLGQNADAIKDSLGIELDFDKDPFIDNLFAVINALSDLEKAGKRTQLESAIASIFGGIRGGIPIKGILSVQETVIENMNTVNALGTKQTQQQKEYNDALADADTFLDRQITKNKNLKKFIGEAWITGTLGAGNYKKALEKIGAIYENILKAQQQLSLFGLSRIDAQVGLGSQFSLIGATFDKIKDLLSLKQFEKGVFEVDNIERLLDRMKAGTFQLPGVDFDEKGLRDALRAKLAEIKPKVEVELVGKDGKSLSDDITDLSKTKNEEAKRSIILSKEQRSALSAIIKFELSILKSRGASNSQLKISEILLKKLFSTDNKQVQNLKDRLNLQKAINLEKEADLRLSSQSLKVFEIAKKFGAQTARDIGQFLQGQISFDKLENLGKSFKVFEQFFPEIIKTQEALDFFKQGAGAGIPIKEEILRIAPIALQAQLKQDITVIIKNLDTGDEKILSEEIIKSFAEQISKPGTLLFNAVKQNINVF